jgi:hypothetical protein
MTKRGSNPTGHRARRVGFALIAVCLVLAALAAHVQAGTGDHAAASPDPVVEWSAVMQATVSHVPDPFLQVRSATIAQVAVFEAVNAIAREYEPYLGGVSAPADASPEAAAIAAASGPSDKPGCATRRVSRGGGRRPCRGGRDRGRGSCR